MRPTCLLLDLDGTLVDSAPGIIASVATALTALGVPVPDRGKLLTFVGPPMHDTFRDVVGLDEQTARRALQLYRAQYAESGALDSRVYDGVPELLEALAAAALPMAVATSKVEDQAERITEHYGLAPYLATVCGTSDGAGRTSKRQVIRECLRRLHAQHVDVSRPLMVGDRGYDVQSAAAEGIPTIRVLWGYGDSSESADAYATADTPPALAQLLATSRELEDSRSRF
ncbi:HAD hydrolase-like protein [Kitasatospora misakiensis]|uniref:HAD hydrolase-like protein n=1 Tax=Kitasatospora misakiensis TaxID=67330 RepID=A0ABW0XB59_9ACTN